MSLDSYNWITVTIKLDDDMMTLRHFSRLKVSDE